MANAATLWTSGRRILLEMDPNADSWTNPATVDEAEVLNITVTASGGAVVVEGRAQLKKYPFVDLVNNRIKLLIELDREILAGETVTIDVPAATVSDGTRSNAAISSLSVTNYSYAVSGLNPSSLLGASARIVYVDPTLGDDTAAAAANGGLGYYVKADVGADPSQPSISVVPYATWKAGLNKARNSTSTANRTANAAILIKCGEVIDGESADSYLIANGGVFQSTGGTGATTPFVVGQYGTGANPILRAQQVGSAAGAQYAFTMSGAAQAVAFLGVDMEHGVNTSDEDQHCMLFSSANTTTRRWIYFKRCRIFGTTKWQFTSTGFQQEYTAFANCVQNADNATGEGGLWSSDGTWSEFSARKVEADYCFFTNAAQGNLFHGFYIKCFSDVCIRNSHFYDIGGACLKLDTCWAVDARRNVFTKCNTIANTETNGQPSGGLPIDRDQHVQTTEYPVATTPPSYGTYANWNVIGDNIISDCLDFNERGSQLVGLIGSMGPSHNTRIFNNLGIFNSDNDAIGLGLRDSGGSSDGYVSDTWDLEAYGNTISIGGTTTRTATALSINPADNDTFAADGDDQAGFHGMNIYNTVFAIGSGRTGTNRMFFFGSDVTEEDYGESFTAGRSSGDWDYCAWYSANGYTSAFRNGGSGDLFSDLASFVTDMNAVDTSMTGNRSEDPGFADPTYQVSDYLTSLTIITESSFASLAAAMTAIQEGILSDTLATALSVAAINSAVRPNYLAADLDEANYDNADIGINDWTMDGPTGELVLVGLKNGGEYTFGEVQASTTPLSGYVDLANLDDSNPQTVGTVVVTGDVTLTADPSDEVIPASGGFRVEFTLDRTSAGDLSGQITIPVTGQADLVFTVTATVLEATGEPRVATTPLNRNLAYTDLDGWVAVVGDSQETISINRFGSHLARLVGEFDRTLVGVHVPAWLGPSGTGLDSVGMYVQRLAPAGDSDTDGTDDYEFANDLNPGDVWPSTSDAGDIHWSYSLELGFDVEPGNFQDLLLAQVTTASFDAFDASGTMEFIAAIHNHAGSVERISLRELRDTGNASGTDYDTSDGNNANYGNGGSGTNYAGDVDWDETGDIQVIRKGIRADAVMPGGSTRVGCVIETSGATENAKQLRMLGFVLRRCGASGGVADLTSPTQGTGFMTFGRSGASAYDHLQEISTDAIDAAIRAIGGFRTVLLILGHNTEDSGTYADNLETLGLLWIARHTALGYSAPKVVVVSMWSFDASESRMETQNTAAHALSVTRTWGFVSMYETYNGDNPADNGARIDGTAATYTMDGSNLHPGDQTTAENIARDMLSHWTAEFLVPPQLGGRSRDRSRER